ncbi:hypothetical protein NM688_g32 [Phlebia brevispora]|uniref:Uncharacterized protein n=1 Tax=Phlebia brevispora TaxID=194682 RepID=A0ACC1TF56_9APHY|nr:hypothetical protein NM688_g32 [Phlebia brevispora]
MTTPKSSASELRALVDLLNGAVTQIEAACASRSQTFPPSHDPFSLESEAARMSPDVLLPGNIIVAAAQQLIAAVRIPALALTLTGLSAYRTASLRLAISVHVSEILREAGPQGLHVKEIAAKTKISPVKLARVLRLLATNHIYKEVAPDVFANNRLSSVLDTGKPVAAILEAPENKFDGTSGISAVLEHLTDSGLTVSGYLAETIMDPHTSFSEEANETAFNKAFSTMLSAFAWAELPENHLRLKRFTIGMKGTQNMVPSGIILENFDWKNLPKGSVLVDVGGGTGHQSLVARAHEHMDVVIQDRGPVISQAVKYWESQFSEAVKAGRVKFQAHDFFMPQPVKEPAVFMLCHILHDWSDKYALIILKQLRAAAGPHTQLLVIDYTIQYACVDSSTRDIPGTEIQLPPAPLLANQGAARVMPYYVDIHMMGMANGIERTVPHFQKLFEQAGWRLSQVFYAPSSLENSKLVAVPI